MSFFKKIFGTKPDEAPSGSVAPQLSTPSVKSDASITLQVGARMMISERGLVSVESISATGDIVVSADDEATYTVAAADVASVLRPIATREEAEGALGLAQEKPALETRGAGVRAIAYLHLIESGSLADRVRALVAMQAVSGATRTYAEDQSQPQIEALVAAELGAAMGVSAKVAKKRLRAALDPSTPQGADLPDRTKELRKHKRLPKLKGLRPIGAIAIEDELCVGEWGYTDDQTMAWVAKAKRGIWYVYEKPNKEDDQFPVETIAAHQEAVSSLLLIGTWREIAELAIEGGTMMIADKEATVDEDFKKEREYGAGGIILGRGSISRLGGDGSCVVGIVADQAPIEVVRITYR